MTSNYRYIVQQRERAKEAEIVGAYYSEKCADCGCPDELHRAADADVANGEFFALLRPCQNCDGCIDYRERDLI